MKNVYFQKCRTQMKKFGDKVLFYNIRKVHTKLCNKQLKKSFFKIMKKEGIWGKYCY